MDSNWLGWGGYELKTDSVKSKTAESFTNILQLQTLLVIIVSWIMGAASKELIRIMSSERVGTIHTKRQKCMPTFPL